MALSEPAPALIRCEKAIDGKDHAKGYLDMIRFDRIEV
jgi:hypothetical protein